VTNSYNNRLRTALSLAQSTGVWTNGFAYDAAKRLTSVTSPAGTFNYLLPDTRPSHLVSRLALPNTSYITNTYDVNARLLSTTLKNSSHTVLNAHSYAYNVGNQRTQQVFNAGSTVNYTYDPIGQLKVADSATAGEDRGYLYDAAWNLTKRTNYVGANPVTTSYTVNSRNELTKVGGADYHYDGNGNRIDIREDLPLYEYDDENQLVTVEYNPGWRSEFSYDGRGRLRQRLEYSGAPGNWTLTATTRYVYDGMRVIQERNASNVPTVSYTRGTDLSGSLEGAGGIGGLLARSHGYSAGNWSTHNYYHADGNGNITYLVNSSQGLAAKYRYDPYGNTLSMSGTLASVNVYRFSSKELHINSGLYYYGFRWYDPITQRWPNRDPINEIGFKLLTRSRSPFNFGEEKNLYAFVGNNPVNQFDPDGQKKKGPIAILIGLLTGCGKGPKAPNLPTLDANCAADPVVKKSYQRLIDCNSADGDGNAECSIVCDCLAQGGGPAVNVCYDSCRKAYAKRCP